MTPESQPCSSVPESVSVQQFSLDLDGQNIETVLNGQWTSNRERDAKNWTTESMAMIWVLGVSDWAWWNSFPVYQRRQWIGWYETAQLTRRGSRADQMETFSQFKSYMDNAYAEDKSLAEHWATLIKEAWLHRQPCPIIPAPEYEHVLRMAFELASLKPELMT